MEQKTKVLTGLGIVLAVVLAIFFLSSAFTGFSVTNSADTIRIGVIAPLTGDNALLGEGMKDAVLLAQKQNTNTKYKYKLIFEDDQLTPTLTTTAANKLVSIDKVSAIISLSSGSGNAVAPIAQASQVMHISLASDANIAKGEYNFVHWTQPEEEANVFVNQLVLERISSIGVISLNHPGAYAIVDTFKKKAEASGISVYVENFNSGDRDFRTQILKEKEKNPDIYFILAYSPELEGVAKQIKELGVTKPITSIEAFDVTSQPELFEGMWYVSAAEPNSEFKEAFKAEYGMEQTYGSANAYDAYNLIVSAFEASSKPDATEAVENLKKTREFSGVLGLLSVDSNNLVQSKAVVKRIVNGKSVSI